MNTLNPGCIEKMIANSRRKRLDQNRDDNRKTIKITNKMKPLFDRIILYSGTAPG